MTEYVGSQTNDPASDHQVLRAPGMQEDRISLDNSSHQEI